MKKTDIAMIVLIASISVIVAFFATNAIFGDASTEEVKVKTIEKIDTAEVTPDTTIFNSNAINPTIEVQVGGSLQSETPSTEETQPETEE